MLSALSIFAFLFFLGEGHCPFGFAGESAGKSPNLLMDENRNGLPDLMELRSYEVCSRFRRWFTAIAEAQFYHINPQWHPDQRDCAGLVRFALREALRPHDQFWFQKMGIEYEPIASDVKLAKEIVGPLHGRFFRTCSGAFAPKDLQDGTFSDFADARTLKNYNCRWVARDWRQAQPGDLLFFNQPWVQKYPLHIMVYLGASPLKAGMTTDWVVYHTGEAEAKGGEVRKVQLSLLERHPDSRWRPLEINPHYLGVFRLKLLGD